MTNLKVRKIAVLGAESTGKTWLCRKLAEHYHTTWVPEYAREYFDDSDIYNYTLDDLEKIAVRQIAMEDEAERDANGFLFCDTTLITLKIWAELEFNECPVQISHALYESRYDLYLVTANDVEWQEDPLRQNKHSRDLIHELNLREIKLTGKPYCLVKGNGESRLQVAVAAVDATLK